MKTINILFFLLLANISFGQLNGYVFVDSNGNGIKDKNEKNLAGAVISDGLNVVKSGEDGIFNLPGWEKQRFVTIYCASGYSCDKRFISIQENRSEYIFPVVPKNKEPKVSFVQISDTETYEHRDWVDNLKKYARVHQPDFIIHTGDICYESGMKWHADNFTTEKLGVPVYYCLGNHDLIKGEYGEQYFEKCFGPAWYAFEEGGTLFVITPMMGGDYKPGFTRKEIGTWLQNLLNTYPKEQPKYFFNHDLLTNGSEFNFRVDENRSINLNEYNLKAWLYGHWHVNMAKEHAPGGVVSYGTATAAKGGIDHSPSGYRVVEVDEKGNPGSYFRWTYVNKELKIVSPEANLAIVNAEEPVKISVNTYDSGSKVDSVKFAVYGEEGFGWKSALKSGKWQKMTKNSDWNWSSVFSPFDQKHYELVVYSYLSSGEIIHAKKRFSIKNREPVVEDAKWSNLGGNKEHYPVVSKEHHLPYRLLWTRNVGSNIYMSSPVLKGNKLVTASFDDGDARNCHMVCFDATLGKERWRYKTKNGIKNQMVVSNDLVIATDMLGITYALNIETGKLVWKQDLEYNRLPGFITGLVTDEETVYSGFGKSLSALNARKGDILWKNAEWGGGEGTTPTMTIADETLLVSKQWGAIYAHNRRTGALLWSRSDEGLRFRDGVLSFVDGSLWVAGRGTKDFGLGNLFQLDLETGKNIQKILTGMQNTGTSAPIILKDKYIVAGSHPGIAAFDRKTGERIWQFEVDEPLFYTPSYFSDKQQSIETTPVLIGNKIVFGGMDGILYVLDANTGRLLWKTDLGAPILTSVAVSDSRIYVCDFAGNVYCFGSTF